MKFSNHRTVIKTNQLYQQLQLLPQQQTFSKFNYLVGMFKIIGGILHYF